MIPLGTLASSRLNAAGGFAYIGTSAAQTANLTTATFTAQPIGDAAASRVVVAVVMSNIANTRTANSCTIGGVSATLDAATSDYAAVSIWRATVPTGTTADVVTTYSGGSSGGQAYCSIYVSPVAVTVSQAAHVKVSGTSANRTVTTTAGGYVIAGLSGFNQTAAITWTNATENFEGTVGSSFPASASTASATTTAGSLTVTGAKASSDAHLSLAVVAYSY